MSVSMRSPIIAVCFRVGFDRVRAEAHHQRVRLCRRNKGSTPVAPGDQAATATDPVAGSGPSGVGPTVSGLVAMNRAPSTIKRIAFVILRSKL